MISKYGNVKTTVDGIEFDSKKEADDYKNLKLLERAGLIENLRLQPEFVLQDGFKDSSGKKHRPITYRGDFAYKDLESGQQIILDSKGFKTEVFKLKHKMFLFRYPDLTLEVR